MKVEIVDFFPTEAGAQSGVFYFNRHKKMAILYRNGNQEVYNAILPNVGQPGSRFKDSDGDGIPDIREASMYDLQDIGWTPSSGSTFNKPTYTSVGGVTINATQVAISSLDNPLNVLFNGSSNTIRINKALQDGAIQRHDNTWDTFVQNQTIDIHNGDYLIYDTFIDSDGDGTSDSKDAFPNDPNEDTDIDGDGVGANTDVDDLDANRSSGNDDDGDGIDNEFDNDPNDGPLGDIDNDGIANNQDVFPADPTNTKYDQQLVWNEMAGPLTTTGGPYGLSASTDSGETISFSIVSGPGTVNGNILNPSSDGVIVVQASAPGNTQYNPASVNKSFNILDASTDTDSDGTPDLTDTDDDNDGVPDTSDNYPTNPNRASGNDNDGDGTDDEFDDDDDNDGILDINDTFPFNSNESADSDGDGIGDNADTDDDNDGIPDTQDSDHPSNTNAPDSDGDGIIDSYDSSDDRTASYIFLGSYDRYDPYSTSYMPEANINSNQPVDFKSIAKLRSTNDPSLQNDYNYVINENLTFSIVNGQTIASLNNGVLSFSAAGTVDLRVSFAGTTSYLAAAPRTVRFTVAYVAPDSDSDGIPDISDPDPFLPNAIMGRSRSYWDTTSLNNTGRLKVDWNFAYQGPGTVSTWEFHNCDSSGNILSTISKPGGQPYYRAWSGQQLGTTRLRFGRVHATLTDGTQTELSEVISVTNLGPVDDPVNYGNFRYEISGTNPHYVYDNTQDFNGSYTAVSGLTFNGAPVFKNNASNKCIVLQHLVLGYQDLRYDSGSWHHWTFTDWATIVGVAGYPNFPTPSDSDPSSFITLPINSYKPLSSMGNVYRDSNGCMDSFERKHPGLFALDGMTIKTYYDGDSTPYQMTAVNNGNFRAIYNYNG